MPRRIIIRLFAGILFFIAFTGWMILGASGLAWKEYRRSLDPETVSSQDLLAGNLPISLQLHVTGCQSLVEQPITLPATDDRPARTFLPVAVAEGQEYSMVIARFDEESEDLDETLKQLADAGTIDGIYYDHRVNEDVRDQLTEQFPNVDFESCCTIHVREEHSTFPFWFITLTTLCFALYECFYAYRVWLYLKRDRRYREMMSEDRTLEYRKHPAGMRLSGATEYMSGTGDLQSRSVDRTWSPPGKRIEGKSAKWLQATMFVVAMASTTAAQIYYGTSAAPTKEKLTVLVLAGLVLLGIVLAVKKKTPSQKEKRLPERKCHFKQSWYLTWHRQVLHELGFTEIGDFQPVNSAAVVQRTIFLSRNENLLVEVGTQHGLGEFFCIESALNNDSFTETHSKLPRSSERIPVAMTEGWAFARQSAKKMDFLEALDAHDKLMSCYTAAHIKEAAITPDNFEAFLSWGHDVVNRKFKAPAKAVV